MILIAEIINIFSANIRNITVNDLSFIIDDSFCANSETKTKLNEDNPIGDIIK